MANIRNIRALSKEIIMTLATGVLILVAAIYFAIDFGVRTPNSLKGKPAPEIEFEYENGKSGAISKQKGKVVLINFWASWCEACMEEMPMLRALENHFGNKGLILLAINVEEAPGEKIRMRLAGEQLPQNLIFNVSKEGLRPYDINTIPLSILIDSKGVVHDTFTGRKNWMDIRFLRLLEELMR